MRLAGLFCGNIIVIRRSDNGKFAGRFIDVLDLFDRKTGRRTRSDLFGYERHGLRIGIFFTARAGVIRNRRVAICSPSSLGRK